MNRFKYNIRWLFIGLVACGLVTFTNQYWINLPKSIQDCLIGIFSSIFLILIIEIRDWKNDKTTYGHLAGTFHRFEIYDVDHKAIINTKYISLADRYRNVPSEISFIYLGDRQYKVRAEYEEGSVVATLFVDSTNPNSASGQYQYTVKHEGKGYKWPDLGTYKLQVDEANYKIVYIYYKNLIANGLAEGYEVWKRD